MRRIWAAGAAIVMCLALGGLPVVGQESSEQPSVAGTTIGFANFYQDDGFFSDIEEGAREAAAAAGVELLVETAWGDPTLQAQQVAAFVEGGVGAIIIVPIDPDAIVPSVEATNAAGIPVLAVDRAATGGTVTSLIASDNVAGGRTAGEFLFEAMADAGKVVEIQGDMVVSSGALRSEGFQEALDAAPGITRVVQAAAYFDYGLAYQATKQALEEDPDISGVFASNLDMLYGAAEGVAAVDKQGQVRVVGFDTDPVILDMIKDGSIDATVAQQPRLMGQKAVEAAIAAVAGETVEPFIPIETILVTADNVDAFLAGEPVAASGAQDEAASPATVEMAPTVGEVLYEVMIPETAIPDALGKVVVDEWTVSPGTDVSIPYDNEGVLGRGMVAESGQLVITPAYDALFWTGEATQGGSPVTAPAREPVTLAVGDVLLLPAIPREQLDPTAEVRIANPGATDAEVFAFHMHWWESFPGWPAGILSTTGITFWQRPELERVQAGDTLFRLTRLTAAPGSVLAFPQDAAFVFDYLKAGAIGTEQRTWSVPGTGTAPGTGGDLPLGVTGDGPAEVLELAVIPSVDQVAPEREPAPSASAVDEAPGGPVIVTGTEACGSRSGGTASYEAGVLRDRGLVAECVNTMSDPRVDGTYVNTYNEDCYQGGLCVLWGTHILDKTEGGWDCSWSATEYPVWDDLLILGVCPGTGGFEGLTYVFQHATADFGDGSTFHGVIYEGQAPAIYTMPAAASE